MSASVKWKPRGCAGGWDKKAVWPVISEAYGTAFAPCVLKENGLYKMWFSWLETNLIAYSESKDGLHWGLAQVALTSKIVPSGVVTAFAVLAPCAKMESI